MATIVKTDYGPVDIEKGQVVSSGKGGVAVFDPAIKGTAANGNPLIVLAINDWDQLFIVDDEGRPKWVPFSEVQLDWRYDWKKNEWADTDGNALEDGG